MITEVTPWSAIVGGALIGLSALLLMATIGKIAGISGISWTMITERGIERYWRVLFLAGLILGASIWFWLDPSPPPLREFFSPLRLVLAGFLVGLGTGLSNGCTSGHGICGLARLSKQSLFAVIVFMAVGITTATVLYHVG